MKKSIGVISQLPEMAKFYGEILKSLFGDIADIFTCGLDDRSLRSLRKCELYLNTCTSYELMFNSWAGDIFPAKALTIQSAVTFTQEAVQLLKCYPAGTRAMLANQNKHMALECISQLYHLGVTNIEFYPYAPEMDAVPEVDIIFTLGPPEVQSAEVPMVDLGLRRLSANTVCELAMRLGNTSFLESHRFSEYLEGLADVDYSLQKLSYDNLTLENKMEMILDALEAAVICINEIGIVTLANRAARTILGNTRLQLVGQTAARVIPEIPFDAEASGQPQLLNIRGRDMDVTVTPLQIQGQYLGVFVKLQPFEEEEERQRRLRLQKSNKPHSARYTFEDIKGSSPAIQKAREIASCVADSDAFVMLEGESGTGKELFAQAIHNASLRKGKPFIAVNCAALTETLLESELFGYVEGAFTGAKKGGKTGLFEYAHQGTLFLDEIETMSPGMQAKLLRVLQEREIVRIGSADPIPVNVRVLSSTNEDLRIRIQEGSFRRDLYYRLNVIPLHLPALRERREDIMQLVETFCTELNTGFTISERAIQALINHHWPGNIRELHNCIEYLWQTVGRGMVELENLPEQFHGYPVSGELSLRNPGVRYETYEHSEYTDGLQAGSGYADPNYMGKTAGGLPAPGNMLPQEWQVLAVLGKYYYQKRGIGRLSIVSTCVQSGSTVTEHDVRLVLRTFQENDWVITGRGRGGTRLSEKGFRHYLSLVGQAGKV